MCREAAHSLQCVPDVRQEAAQRPLQVDLRTTLHRLQADAAQRVAAQDGGERNCDQTLSDLRFYCRAAMVPAAALCLFM